MFEFMLGSVLKYEDRHAVPVNLVAWDPLASDLPGVLIHAQVLRNLLGDGLIQPVATWIPVLLALCAALLWLWAPRPNVALLLLEVLWAACLAVSTLAHTSDLQQRSAPASDETNVQVIPERALSAGSFSCTLSRRRKAGQ